MIRSQVYIFSCLTQLTTRFHMLIKIKTLRCKESSCFKFLRCCIYHANKCLNNCYCWHYNINELDRLCAQLG